MIRNICLLFLCLCALACATLAVAQATAPFAFHAPGYGYLDGVVDPTGALLPGRAGAVARARLAAWAPVLRETRNRYNTEVLLYAHGGGGADDGMLAGLLACGIQPAYGATLSGRRLIIAAKAARAGEVTALRAAVEAGALLYITPEADPAIARAFGLIPASNKMSTPRVIDLSGLRGDFPALAGVKISASPAGGGNVSAGSTLKRVNAGKRLIAWSGAVGHGRVLYLNCTPTPGVPANRALLHALLQRAGVQEAFSFTGASGSAAAGILGFLLESVDGTQAYLVAVATQQQHARLYLRDRRLTSVRDLDTARTLPWHTNARGRYVEVSLAQGDGTVLALLAGRPGGSVQVLPAQASVGDEAVLAVQVKRVDATGHLLPCSHAFRVSLRGVDGAPLAGTPVTAAGPSPQVLLLPITRAVTPGHCSLAADDLTDGTQTCRALEKRAPGKPAPGVQLTWGLPPELVRGRPLHGTLTLTAPVTGGALPQVPLVFCDEPGVAITIDRPHASGAGVLIAPFTFTVPPTTTARSIFLGVDADCHVLGGTVLALPPAYRLELDPLPRLAKGATQMTLRGTVVSSVAAAPALDIMLGIPAACFISGGQHLTVQPAQPGTPASFSVTVRLHGLPTSRIQVFALAPGFPPVRAEWNMAK